MAAKKSRPKNVRKGAAAAQKPQSPEPENEIGQAPPQAAAKPAMLSAVPRQLKPRRIEKPPEPEQAEPESGQEAANQEPPESEGPAETVETEASAPPTGRLDVPEAVTGEEKQVLPWGGVPNEASPMPLPPAGRGEAGSPMKAFAVVALLCAAVFLAYYFITLPENSFVPGAKVDAETFKGIFLDAANVYIVMDVRGAGSAPVSTNILQCGVDFAASSGMGGKSVTYLSFGSEGCVAPDGAHPPKECFAMLKNGITIYVKEAPGEVSYYSNGMVVPVGADYVQGTCGIKRY
ncbi:hypothetical protein L0Y65_01975 [Candidatus Micrarchaeota archaeon]|nr:hypothetical protein [Candidatus Micrarchaeota archaeon]